MNAPRASAEDYIQYLIASPSACSAVDAAKAQPRTPDAPAHDAFTRLLTRLEPDADTLWTEVAPLVPADGVLVIDDTTLDKPYARNIDLVSRHGSGKHKAVVRGINLVTAVWYDGGRFLPVDYRVDHPDRVDPTTEQKRTKNGHFADMIRAAKTRGLEPRCVLFDGWYASRDNLKRVRDQGWTFLDPAQGEPPGPGQPGRPDGRVRPGGVRRRDDGPAAGYGEIKVFRVIAPDGGAEHWTTNDLGMTALDRYGRAQESWSVETYHRGLKQHTEVERCQARQERSQRSHIGLAIRAFVRLECHRWATGISWFEAKVAIIRAAVRQYLKDPKIKLPNPATA